MADRLTKMRCRFGMPAQTTEIFCGSGILRDCLADGLVKKCSSLRVVVDKQVWKLHEMLLRTVLPQQSQVLQIPGGERAKGERQLRQLWKWLHQTETDRRSLLIAIGGGATTDLVGLAASTYMRGVDLVLVPTTLLAQVDAAIGGKTAINLEDTKNIIGTFHPARRVICDSAYLDTLRPKQLREGMIEALKAFAALDAVAYRRYRDRLVACKPGDLPAGLIAGAVKLKCKVVERDPTESGWRKVLNLGHTTGHAYELLTGASHGEGVAFGMLVAAELSKALLNLAPRTAEELIESVRHIYPRFRNPGVGASDLWSKIAHDKKRSGKDFNFVLLRALGRHKVLPVTRAQFGIALIATKERLKQ
ncbi:MAG: 3-dehydroquinate synthase family protein [bacterium]